MMRNRLTILIIILLVLLLIALAGEAGVRQLSPEPPALPNFAKLFETPSPVEQKDPADYTAADLILLGGRAEVKNGTRYDTSAGYYQIDYPGGDVDPDIGVCTDVVIRAFRNASIDLQQLIHEDMRSNFALYPANWGLDQADSNIDHRRIPNQRYFMERYGQALSLDPDSDEWQHGDIVYWRFLNGDEHCGIISDRQAKDGKPLVIHNSGITAEQDCLTRWEITAHYRYPAGNVAVTAIPAAQDELSGLVAAFMEERGLNDGNISISYYNTVTGESYALADTTFRFAASTYKLPLNMYYYEQEVAGARSGDDLIADYTLAKCHYLTMVWSDNDSAIAMLRELGKFRTYRELMLTYGNLEESEIEPIYYEDNYCCTKYMLNVLRYLYERQDTFDKLIGYMKQAQQSEYFCAGVDEYEIAHKYGFLEGTYNDVGIIYTPTPYLLAVYTQDAPNAGALLGDINRLFCDYTIAAR